ncbi:MAG: D-ribose pyranase [Bacillota bacterium]
MKKSGILNSQLAGIVASMGHTDKLVICDSGLPIPRGAEVVDLALTANIPKFIDTLNVILIELKVEEVIIADEMEELNNSLYKQILQLFSGVKIKRTSHEEFKRLTHLDNTVAFVRTGEATPYANIILSSGVAFS